ncbi:hypothetical protein F5883DRAFT_442250 [Diaporthe sp. PMI_573]|nr:hypothetical protein F5883DRAFT_442250 [Diaporthaceae sp. PMI_573]
MPFPFTHVCDLLQRLDGNRRRKTPRPQEQLVGEWFAQHKDLLGQLDFDPAALLSVLLPEKRTDRVYNIREKKLQGIVAKAQFIGKTRMLELGRWENPGSDVDLADCVESLLNATPNPSSTAEVVTIEMIDRMAEAVASRVRFSSPAVRAPKSSFTKPVADSLEPEDPVVMLQDMYRMLTARDAKWFTRLVLKSYEPVVIDPDVVYRAYHPLLPSVMHVHDHFALAGATLKRLDQERRASQGPLGAGDEALMRHLVPVLGVKVGRQPWLKGRSIKHCLNMGYGRMSCEEKLDGEYCQIHIDLSKLGDPSKGSDCIQIYSKSGKDSTQDRKALHESILESLQIGKPSCPLTKSCILEGELVVYNDKDARILDFYNIRKYVSRSGSYIGLGPDSRRDSSDHLMIVYYDVLMIDDTSLLHVRHSQRMERLQQLVTCVQGRSALVARQVIDFDRASASTDLLHAFATCIQRRQEGLVLKADDPYFNFSTDWQRYYISSPIKLKKEYFQNLGEVGDFAVVGARYDAAKAKSYGIPRLKWTHFYIGCLKNAEAVRRWNRPPEFLVTNVVELNKTQLNYLRNYVNPEAILVKSENNPPIDFDYTPGIDNGKRPSLIFIDPLVFDIRSFSFDKAASTNFWSPRFAMVSKIHLDRSYTDVLSFEELQDMAIAEKEQPLAKDELAENLEIAGWMEALKDKGDREDDDELESQATTSRGTTPSDCSLPSSPSPDTQVGDSEEAHGSPLRPTARSPIPASQASTESASSRTGSPAAQPDAGSPQHAPETPDDNTAPYNRKKRRYSSSEPPSLTNKVPRHTQAEVRPDDGDAPQSSDPGICPAA